MTSNIQSTKAIQILLPYIQTKRLQKFVQVLLNRSNAIHIVLENLKHPLNGVACLRTADGFGIQNIHFIKSKFKNNAEKVSTGVNKWVNVHHHQNYQSCIEFLRERSYTLIGVSPNQIHKSLSDTISNIKNKNIQSHNHDPVSPLKLALVFGNESGQVSTNFVNNCDHIFKLHQIDSHLGQDLNLNLASALSILNHSQILRKHPDVSSIPQWPMSDNTNDQSGIDWVWPAIEPSNNIHHPLTQDEKNNILLNWLVKTTPHAKKLLKQHSIIYPYPSSTSNKPSI